MRLAEMVAALSLATDLGTGHPLERALRTCLLAVRLGALLPLNDTDLQATYYTALLRFIGCSSDMQTLSAIFGDEQAAQARSHLIELVPEQMILEMLRYAGDGYPLPQRLRMLMYGLRYGVSETQTAGQAHCEVSQNIARRLGLPIGVQEALGQLFERWDGRGIPGMVRGESLTQAIRLVHLAEDMELYYRVGGVAGAIEIARTRKSRAYDPQLVERFTTYAETLCADLERDSVWELVLAMEPTPCLTFTNTQLDTLARAISDFTDLRSPYTYGHSVRVGDLCYEAAQRYGLTSQEAIVVRRAGYVHDVGRTAISLAIWDKQGPLTPGEWDKARLYPYYSERILARPTALAEWGKIAGLHRERLDGSGYHRGFPGTMLSPQVCLLAAADVYQSKLEPRTYRPAMTHEQAVIELRQQVRERKLDGAAVDAVLAGVGQGEIGRRAYPAGLSEREVEVLRLLSSGLSNRQIAETLVIAPKTVGHHVQHIYNKVGCSTRAAATLFALQHNLLSPGPSHFWR